MSDNEQFENAPQGGKRNRKNNKRNKNAGAQDAELDDAALEAEAARKREAQEAMLAAGEGSGDDSDDDPIFGKKKKGKGGKKGQQDDNRKQRQGKKGRKGQAAQEEEEEAGAAAEEEKKAEDSTEETTANATSAPISYPLQVVYCAKCGLPPEYCEWAGRGQDLDDCKKWLAENHTELFDQLYPPVEDEESKEAQPKKKKGKKVGFAADQDKKVRVIKQKRGGKKIVSSIIGMDAYGCDLADAAKVLSRKLGTGAAAMMIEYRELKVMGVQVQGDVSERFTEIIAQDFASFNIPAEKIIIEDGGNKKNRTMGGGR